MQKGDKCTLISDVSEVRQGKIKILGKSGDQVTVIRDSFNVAIVEDVKGERFTVQVDGLELCAPVPKEQTLFKSLAWAFVATSLFMGSCNIRPHVIISKRPTMDGICHYEYSTIGEVIYFEDSCSMYHVGDTIK